MEQSSASRPKLVPRKFFSASIRNYSVFNNSNDSTSPKRGLKRKNDSNISCGSKRPFKNDSAVQNHASSSNYETNKFSANTRLLQYRKSLENKQNEIVKVHTLQNATADDTCHKNPAGSMIQIPAKQSCSGKSVNERFQKFKEIAERVLSSNQNTFSNTVSENFDGSSVNECSQQLEESAQKALRNASVHQDFVPRVAQITSNNFTNRNYGGKNVNDTFTAYSNKSPKHISVDQHQENWLVQTVLPFTKANCSQNFRLKKYKESALDKKFSMSGLENESIEDMDWSPFSEEQLLTDISNLRQNKDEILNYKCSLQTDIFEIIPQNNYIFKDTYIVVDTNIFLSHLNDVQHLLNIKLNGVERPYILIPWVVIQELDYIKDGRDGKPILQAAARKAVAFINKNLLADGTTIKGQSIIDATKHSFQCENLDDGILACCLQIIERGNRAILLSNDKNLRNKALIHSVHAYSSEEIFKELVVSPPSEETNDNQYFSKSEQIKTELTNYFNIIIHGEALRAYGEYYYKMGVFKDAPWNLEQCLQKFEKLWIAVFSEKFPKQFLQSVEAFRTFLCTHKCINSESDNEQLIKYGLNVCLYLKNSLNDYFQLTTECIERVVALT